MKKRLFSILLSLAMVITMMPAMASISFAGEADTTVPVELVKATTSGSRAVKLSWNKVSGATKYVVYGQKCGKKYKKLTTTSKTSYKVKKIKKTKLKAHKNYKFYVAAYKGGKKLVTSKSIHFITGKTMGKYANAKSIKVSPTSVTLEPGKTATLKATTKIYKNKKHIKKSHGAATRYVSDNTTVASVNANGVITANKEGAATIYVQDIGGLWCKTVVTVKSSEPPAPTEYTVTFNMQGHGTQIDPLNNVISGSKISAPTAPTAAGYTFGGWYKEAACTNAWNFNEDTVTTDTTLYAKWSQNPTPPPAPTEYTVSFDLNGATGEVPTAQTIASGGTATKPNPTFTNHTLEGWYKTKNADGTLSNKWDFNSPVTADMTLYARWTRRIVDIIETVNFPMYTNDIPTNAWMDSSKPNNRVYGYNNLLFNILYVKANSQSDPLLQLSYSGMASDNAEKNGDSYTYSNDYMKYTVTFNMTNKDTLESIEVKALEGADENVLNAVGTYAPACTITFEPEKDQDIETGEVQDINGQKVTELIVPSGTAYNVDGSTITIGGNGYHAVANNGWTFHSFVLNPDSQTITADTTIIVCFSQNQPG
ncbi:MAG: InlB B-repeat-containing protein [Clostridiales bacterium]|nr:InlB B-repeat-containing protein [Candidatus Crickella equi]